MLLNQFPLANFQVEGNSVTPEFCKMVFNKPKRKRIDVDEKRLHLHP